jgi:hypothetical protein
MLATKILTHVIDALNRRMQQYKAIPAQYTLSLPNTGTDIEVSHHGAIIAILADGVQALENAIFDLDHKRQLFDGSTFPAIGAQLDGIGELVGIARNGLPDADYLVFILGTIAKNTSDTTITAVVNITSLLFQVPTIISFELFPAEMAFQIPDNSPLDVRLFSVVANIIQSALGAGIGLGFISTFPSDAAFRFTSVGALPIGAGFGDLNDPDIGGGFAGNIYNNPGA